MADTFFTDLFFILITLLVTAILGFFIGWLLHGYRVKVLQKSLDTCYNLNRELKKKLIENSMKGTSRTKVASTYIPPKTNSSKSTEVSFDSSLAKKIMGKPINKNDIKIVEGIGPKIEQLLSLKGIRNWEELSNSSTTELKSILKNGGDSFSFHKPDTWSNQAKLAHEGKWDELKKLQDYLKGGVDPNKK
ncbi:MAG: hypothetical protein ACPGVD_03300 [Flavobacteriales bacterium]